MGSLSSSLFSLSALEIYWMSLCLVEKRANWSLSCTFFLIQQHIILPAAGGKETDGQASKPPALSHFLPPNQKRSVGVIWSPAHSLRSLSHTQKGQQHLSLCPWSSLRAMPRALRVNIPAGEIPAKSHPHWRREPARRVMSTAAFQRPLLCFALNFLAAHEKGSDKSRAV